ncbi:MAG: OmpA family protein [Bacteroidota bacterium]
MKTTLLVVLFISLSLGGQAQVKTVTTYLSSAEKRADHLYEHQHYQEAAKLYQQALQKEPQNGRIKLQLAESFRKLNNPGQAVWWYSQVINDAELIAPEHQLRYAQALLSIGEIREAEVWYTHYQQSAPDDERVARKLHGIDQMSTFYRDSLMYTVEPLDGNSSASDFAPAFYQKGIVFISARETRRAVKQIFHWNETPYLSRFFLPDGDEAIAQLFSVFDSNLKQSYHEGPVVFYDNDARAILTRNYPSQNRSLKHINTLGLFASQQTDNSKWSTPEPLSFNNPAYSVGHPTVTPDGKTLYFISDMPGGVGGTDLYVSHYQDGAWQTPTNLGKPVNTEGDEMFPFIHSDQTLYFSSDGHSGLGGLDIYKTVMGSSFVENLGYPINSSYDDFSLILNEEGTQGYYASNRGSPARSDELYRLTVHYQHLDILVSDEHTGQRISDAEVTLIQDGAEVSTVASDSTGLAQFQINPHRICIINVDKPDYDGNAVIVTPEEVLASDKYAMVPVPLARSAGSIDLTIILANSYTDQPFPHTLVSIINIEKGDTTLRTTDDQGKIRMKVDNRSHYAFSGKVGETDWSYPEGLSRTGSGISTRTLNPDQENELQLLVGIQTPTIPLHFTVYDAETQEPVDRVTVRLIEDGEERAELRTTAEGKATFKADPQKNYLVSLEAPIHFGDVVIILSEELRQDTVYQVEVPLKSRQETVAWVANLYDSVSGIPINYAIVHLQAMDTNEVVKVLSDEWGQIQVDLEKGKSYRISSHRDDRSWIRGQPIVAQGQQMGEPSDRTTTRRIILREEITEESSVPLLSDATDNEPATKQERTQLLSVRVEDKETGKPLSTAEIILIGDGALEGVESSDTTGLAQFTIDPTINFILDVSKDEYQGNAIILDTATLLSYSDSYEAAVALRPQKGTVNLAFRLYDGRTGRAIKRTLTQLVNLTTDDTLRLVTDERGEIQTKVDDRSSYRISGVVNERPWDYPIIEANALNPESKNQISIPIEVPILTTPLRVVAVDTDTKSPIAEATVRLIEDGEQKALKQTDSRGEVQIEVNPENSYLISVESTSHYDDVAIVMADKLVPQKEHRVEVALIRGKKMVSMVAHIYDSLSKEPLTNTLVRIYNETTGREITSLSDERGNIRMKLERRNSYQLSGRANNQNWDHDAKISIDDHSLADLELRIAVYNVSSEEEWMAEAGQKNTTKDVSPPEKEPTFDADQLINARVTVVDSHQRSKEDQAVWVEIGERIYHLVQQNDKQYLRHQNEKIFVTSSTGLSEHWWLNTDNGLITISTIYFGFDEHILDAVAERELTKIAELMKRQPSLRLEATTHTDSRGPQSYNRVLSQKRAQAIANNLVELGIAEERVYLNFYGEDKLLAPCPDDGCSESVHHKNRRGEFTLDFIYE